MTYFLDSGKKEYIDNIIKKNILKNLNDNEFSIIMIFLYNIINYVTIRIGIDLTMYKDFWYQLTQNNNRDLYGLFNLLLPYIDDVEGSFKLHHEIRELKDISTKLINNMEQDLSVNNFLISNVQYNLYYDYTNEELEELKIQNIISEKKYNSLKNNKLHELKVNEIAMNYLTLITTIYRVGSKLFVNWLNIIPLTLSNYKNSYLYKNSIKLVESNSKLPFTHGKKDINFSFFVYPDSVNENNIKNISVNIDNFGSDDNIKQIYIKLIDDTIVGNNIYNIDDISKNKGIVIGDIINTLMFDLYYDVKKIKWLIFQGCFDNDNVDEIYIKKFNELIAVSGLYNNVQWNELTIDEQIEFNKKWSYYLQLVLNSKKKNINHYFLLLKNIIIRFEENYKKFNAIKTKFNYKSLLDDIKKPEDEDNYFDNEEDITTLDETEVLDRIKVLPLEDIYTFLLESIQQFIPTWYGRNIIIYENQGFRKQGVSSIKGLGNIVFNYDSYVKDTILELSNYDYPEKLELKYKYIYNYAKSFVKIFRNVKGLINSSKSYDRDSWHTSSYTDKYIFISFLNYSYLEAKKSTMYEKYHYKMSTMSFEKYMRRTYGNLKIKIDDILGDWIGINVFNIIRKNIINITFECHILKGLLNEFVIDKRLTDNRLLGSSYNEITNNQFKYMKELIFTEDKLDDYKKNSYYFLTKNTYGNLDNIQGKHYFDLLTIDYRWYSFYSMDWVSQINFFHRYINNRVMYITGATGQGKSTQIPKLFLYGLTMIDRKLNGKVICSQPRVNPTVENSARISYELGVPIFEESVKYKQKIKTFNPYIQYKTKNDYHIVDSQNVPLLKIVTDKILLQELQKSPIFKEVQQPYDNDETGNANEFNKYMDDNMYDIIMVDESHEHNVNMDLILTVARDTIKLNNSLKLVIVSATMDDDEPIYRKYYKEINDNFMYPYNLHNSTNGIDRTFIDRRMHISPPGETTQHKIYEHYLDKEPIDYKEAEELGINKVKELINSSNVNKTKGDILLFSLSKEDVNKICKKLNSEIQKDSKYICLPYYSELPTRWNIFSNLSNEVKKITTHRESLFDDIFPSSTTVKKVSPGTYTNVIIVATNIAEASITVSSLKYVVDTGYNIIVSENPATMDSKVERLKISEASRKQRKGRIGRVSSGTIYYMYKKDGRKHIKSKYKICTQNISLDLYDLMTNNDEEYNYIIPLINYTDTVYKPINELKKYFEYEKLMKTEVFDKLIVKHYTLYGIVLPSIINLCIKHSPKTTESNENYKLKYDNLKEYIEIFDNIKIKFDRYLIYTSLSIMPIRYINGYNIKFNIYDTHGLFYIIHPAEDIIKRNILTNEIITIIRSTGIIVPDNRILSENIYYYIQRCFDFNLLINNNFDKENNNPLIYVYNKLGEFDNLYLSYEKTNIGRIMQQIISSNQFDIHEDLYINRYIFMTIIYSYVADIDDIVITMIALLKLSNYNLNSLLKDYSESFAFKLPLKKVANNILGKKYGNNDLLIYYKLAKEFNRLILRYEEPFNVDSKINIFDKEKEQFLKEKKVLLVNLKNKNKTDSWEFNIDLDIYEKFNILSNQNKLNSELNIYDFSKETAKKPNATTINNIILILQKLGINNDYIIAKNFVKFYYDLKNTIHKLKNSFNIKLRDNNLLWFKYHLPIRKSIDEFINVKKAFIYGFGIFQTIFYDNDKFISVEYKKKYFILENSLTPTTKFMVYLLQNSLNNKINILIDTDADTIAECNILNYDPYYINANHITIESNKKLYELILEIYAKKQYYLSHLKLSNYKGEKLLQYNNNLKLSNYKGKKLFQYNNNLIPYIIKRFSSNIKSNIYSKNTDPVKLDYIKQEQINKYNQNRNIQEIYGGYNSSVNKVIIKISDIPVIMNKFNISHNTFTKKINKLINNGCSIVYI